MAFGSTQHPLLPLVQHRLHVMAMAMGSFRLQFSFTRLAAQFLILRRPLDEPILPMYPMSYGINDNTLQPRSSWAPPASTERSLFLAGRPGLTQDTGIDTVLPLQRPTGDFTHITHCSPTDRTRSMNILRVRVGGTRTPIYSDPSQSSFCRSARINSDLCYS